MLQALYPSQFILPNNPLVSGINIIFRHCWRKWRDNRGL